MKNQLPKFDHELAKGKYTVYHLLGDEIDGVYGYFENREDALNKMRELVANRVSWKRLDLLNTIGRRSTWVL